MQEGTKVIINYMFMSLNQFYLRLTEMVQSFPCGKLMEMQLTKMVQGFFVTQMIKNLPAMQGTQVGSLTWEEMTTHSNILA